MEMGYTTALNERIDGLAHKFYGGNFGISIIADANPDVSMTAVYPLGTELIIPIIDANELADKSKLPPWKQ